MGTWKLVRTKAKSQAPPYTYLITEVKRVRHELGVLAFRGLCPLEGSKPRFKLQEKKILTGNSQNQQMYRIYRWAMKPFQHFCNHITQPLVITSCYGNFVLIRKDAQGKIKKQTCENFTLQPVAALQCWAAALARYIRACATLSFTHTFSRYQGTHSSSSMDILHTTKP